MHARIHAFVGFAKACSEAPSGFLTDLDESDRMLYDLVITMGNMYVPKEENVRIDGRYYRFFKTYEKDILAEIKSNDLGTIEEELEFYGKQVGRFSKKMRARAHSRVIVRNER